MRNCDHCGVDKPVEDFLKESVISRFTDNGVLREWHTWCRLCRMVAVPTPPERTHKAY